MKINESPPTSWKDLQEQVARILRECGLKADVERELKTARGTVCVDVYAIDETQMPPPVCLCECKYWSTPVTKEKVHAFRTVVADFGASWGFLISRGGFQSGAYEAAEYSNIKLLTWEEFENAWMNRWIEKYLRPTLFVAHEPLSDYTEPLLGNRIIRKLEGMNEIDRDRFLALRQDPSKVLPANLALHYGAPWHNMLPNGEFALPLNARVPGWALEYAPDELVGTESLRRFGEVLCTWIIAVQKEFEEILEN